MKPIKCGIKVFVMCSADGYVNSFEVYQGKGAGRKSTHRLVVEDLIPLLPEDVRERGIVLYADNWYSSVGLAVDLKHNYGIDFVGTYAPKKGAPAGPDSFPFRRLTASEQGVIDRGKLRRATKRIMPSSGESKKKVTVQAHLWKDSKTVGVIDTRFIGPATEKGSSVKRTIRGKYKGVTINCHDAILAYLEHYGAVDRADRGIADFTTSRKSNRWYMRVFFWILDAALWNMWVIAKYMIESPEATDEWKKYDTKENRGTVSGRYLFMLDVADCLMDWAAGAAIEKAGGERKDVRWLKNEAGNSTPSAQEKKKPGPNPNHRLVAQPGRRPCAVCYGKQPKVLSQDEKRKKCRYTRDKCNVCGTYMCDDCFVAHHMNRGFEIAPTTRDVLCKRWAEEKEEEERKRQRL
jgi:hypothetical protein